MDDAALFLSQDMSGVYAYHSSLYAYYMVVAVLIQVPSLIFKEIVEQAGDGLSPDVAL
jgi:hypothetical protein